MLVRKAAELFEESVEPAAGVVLFLGGDAVEHLFRDEEHNIGGDERHGEHPCEANPEGDVRAEDADGRDGREDERGEPRDGGERCVEHRHEEVADDVADGLFFVAEAMIGVEEFAQNMNGVGDGDGHEEDGDHRTHDVDVVAESDEESHGAEYTDDGDEHRRDDERDAPEEEEQEQEDDESGERRGAGHLDEHFDPEGVLRDGLAGDVDLIFGGPVGGQFFDEVGDVVAVGFFKDWNVEGDGFLVFGNEGSFVERVVHGIVADRERLVARRGRLFHEVFNFECAVFRLFDVVDHRGADEFRFNDGAVPVVVEEPVGIISKNFGEHALAGARGLQVGNGLDGN